METVPVEPSVPNHHSHYHPFAGPTGVLAAVGMALHKTGRATWAADLAQVTNGDVVVDIGCGPGNAARLAKRRGAAAVIGVDPAPVMLRVARVLTRGSKIRYEIGSAEKLPLSGDVATVAWSLASVHHWHDVTAGLAEARRVLQDGGRFIAIEAATVHGAHGLASHGWTDDQAEVFAQMAKDSGFREVRVERHNVDHRDHIAVVAIA
jgi:ubiquinone/menaquinone biosynthesis C-methylase UbiE